MYALCPFWHEMATHCRLDQVIFFKISNNLVSVPDQISLRQLCDQLKLSLSILIAAGCSTFEPNEPAITLITQNNQASIFIKIYNLEYIQNSSDEFFVAIFFSKFCLRFYHETLKLFITQIHMSEKCYLWGCLSCGAIARKLISQVSLSLISAHPFNLIPD